jgi:chemotaxis protein MotA
LDKSTFIGILIAIGGIGAGLLLEGGKIAQVLQPTAAMIVFGGTLGAVMVQFPLPLVTEAFKRVVHVLLDKNEDPKKLVSELLVYAQRARREGIVSLDSKLNEVSDPFLKKALMLAVDGTDPEELRKMMELDLDNQMDHSDRVAQVF